MGKYVILVLFLILSACGQKPMDSGFVNINTDFQPYVNRFVEEGRNLGRDIQINNLVIDYEEMSGNIIGLCHWGSPRRIGVNPRWWNSRYVSNTAREQLMFHELGHCVLNRYEHTNQTVLAVDANVDMPVSIMNAYHFSSAFYERNLTYYLKELFELNPVVSLYMNTPNTFPAEYYASTTTTVFAASSKIEGELTEEMYGDISNFGCGHQH